MSAGELLKRAIATVGVAGFAIVGAWIYGQCQFTAGATYQQLTAAGDTTDRHRAQLVARIVELEAQVRRDSTARAGELAMASDSSAAARRRSDSLEAALKRQGPLASDVAVVLEALHATIRAQGKELAEKDRALLFWQSVAADRARERDEASRQRDEYRDQRDAWRKQARPRCGADVGAGYGLNSHKWDAWVGVGCRIPLPRVPFIG